MTIKEEALRIFVAMPSKENMAEHANWKNRDEIKEFFFSKICDQLKEILGRKVELFIEDEKKDTGGIHQSMYTEAWQADVYVADLTGSNANVFLELGVRWALRDGITILISQDISEIKFNVHGRRIIPYGKDPAPLHDAIESVKDAIINGLKDDKHCDSPVRESLQFVPIDKDKLNDLHKEINRLKEERGEEKYSIAVRTLDSSKRIDLLKEVISMNPAFIDAYPLLGSSYRKSDKLDEAIDILSRATQLFPKCAKCYRELGIAVSKKNELTSSIGPLEEAIKLDPGDFDAQSALGGIYRKLGMKEAPQNYDWESLMKARECYEMASELKPHDTYPLVNVARLDLIISKIEPERKERAFERFEELIDLCRFESRKALKELEKNPGNPELIDKASWRLFDHADTLLLSGKIEEGKLRYQQGLELVNPTERKSVLSSVISPLKNFLTANVLEEDIKKDVKDVIDKLESAF